MATATLPVVANEMLNDPAILMTSKNPSLSAASSGGARHRHSAGVSFVKDSTASGNNEGDIGAKPKPGKGRSYRRRRRNTNTVEEQENVEPSTSASTSTTPTTNGKRRRSRKFNKANGQTSPNTSPTQQDSSANKAPADNQPKVNQSPRGKSGASTSPGNTRFPFHNARNFDAGISNVNRFARTNPSFSPYHPYNRNLYSPLVLKPGLCNEYVSRQIVDYHLRNRQTNEMYKSKQILRQSLENTLKQVFPNQFINLHLVGSTTNGIGDNVSSVDICILSRKREQTVLLPPNPPTSPVNATNISQPATSTTTETETEKPASESDVTESVESTESAEPVEAVASTSDEEVVVIDSNESNDSGEESPSVELNKDEVIAPVEEAKEASEMEIDQVAEAESAEADATKNVELPKSPETQKQDSTPNNADSTAEQTNLTLDTIETVLRGKNYAKDIKIILAKVPVIKFKDNITGINVTLNLNQDVSIRNSQLIRDYAKMDWRFPHLVMVMKQWARENRVNSAIDKTISSYGWTLMVIHYLQVCDPPVLPCLHKMIPRRYDSRVNIEQAMNNWRKPINQWRSNNLSNLRQLLKSMFRYYGYVFNYDQQVISVRDGKVLERTAVCQPRFGVEDNNPNQWNTFFCVEEPFNRNNVTRSVHDKETFDRIIELIRTSSNALKGNRISLFNIIADDLDFPITY